MRRTPRPHPSQLTLGLAPEPVQPLLAAEEPTLVQALADLLLSALGWPAPGDQTAATTATEGGDEPEDHP